MAPLLSSLNLKGALRSLALLASTAMLNSACTQRTTALAPTSAQTSSAQKVQMPTLHILVERDAGHAPAFKGSSR